MLRRAAIALLCLLCTVPSSVAAQYNRPVLVYDNGCGINLEAKVNRAAFATIGANQYGVRGISVRVGVVEFGAPGRLSERATPNVFAPDEPDAAYLGTGYSDGTTCRWSLHWYRTDSLVRQYRAYAEDADRSARGYRRIATGFFVGAVVIAAGTLAYTLDQAERNEQGGAVPLVAGLSVAGVALWGGGQMLDLAWEPSARRDKYRNLERWILQESR